MIIYTYIYIVCTTFYPYDSFAASSGLGTTTNGATPTASCQRFQCGHRPWAFHGDPRTGDFQAPCNVEGSMSYGKNIGKPEENDGLMGFYGIYPRVYSQLWKMVHL